MTGRSGRPAWWSVTGTAAALRILPSGGARDRWRDELTAELWYLTRREQLRHTLGVLRRAPALRLAVTARDRIIGESVPRRPLRCRLGSHRWVTRYTSDGTSRYLTCSRCPKTTDFEQRPPLIVM
jgi:hypothetical protein